MQHTQHLQYPDRAAIHEALHNHQQTPHQGGHQFYYQTVPREYYSAAHLAADLGMSQYMEPGPAAATADPSTTEPTCHTTATSGQPTDLTPQEQPAGFKPESTQAPTCQDTAKTTPARPKPPPSG